MATKFVTYLIVLSQTAAQVRFSHWRKQNSDETLESLTANRVRQALSTGWSLKAQQKMTSYAQKKKKKELSTVQHFRFKISFDYA